MRATFFSEFESKKEDFLATFLGTASSKLFFYPTAKVLEAEPMSCLFQSPDFVRTKLQDFMISVKKYPLAL